MIEPLKGTPSRLCHNAISTGTDTLFTVDANNRAAITDIHAANTTASAIRLTVGISGVSAANQIVPNVSIPAYSVYTLSGFIILNASETIQATAAATGITLTICGVDKA